MKFEILIGKQDPESKLCTGARHPRGEWSFRTLHLAEAELRKQVEARRHELKSVSLGNFRFAGQIEAVYEETWTANNAKQCKTWLIRKIVDVQPTRV